MPRVRVLVPLTVLAIVLAMAILPRPAVAPPVPLPFSSFHIGSAVYAVDAAPAEMEVPAFIHRGQAFATLPAVAHALGATIPEDQAAAPDILILGRGGREVRLRAGSPSLTANGQDRPMDAAPLVLPSGTMAVPIRPVAEALGFETGWHAEERAVLVGPPGELPEIAHPVAVPPSLVEFPLEDYLILWDLRARLPATLDELRAMSLWDDAIGYHARAAVAAAARLRGDWTEAAEYSRLALELRDDPGERRELARALEAVGDSEGAMAEWSRLLPLEEAREAVRRLAEPPRAAELFNRRRLFHEALAVLEGVEGPSAALQRARALQALRRHGDAVREFSAFLRHYPGDARARTEYASSLERLGRWQEALAVYTGLGRAGSFGRGRALQALGRTDEAIKAFRAAPEAEAQWRAARLLERLERFPEALAAYESLAFGTSPLADDAALRCLVLTRRIGRGDRQAEYRLRLSPGLAYLAGVEVALPAAAGEDDAPNGVVMPAAALLDFLGPEAGREWAQAEVDILLARGAPEDRLQAAGWLKERGEYHRALRAAVALAPHLPADRLLRLRYPLAYWDLVRAASERFQLDPLLILAIMRTESHFRADAISVADARGLMQILPTTGEWIAERAGWRTSKEALFDPAHNILLGAWYIRHLLDTFDGEYLHAIAAYNGGWGSVQRWVASPDYRERTDFPWIVGFTETREYVSLVLGDWLMYRWLYGESPG
ncbi:MAG TPA: transglycosylase SLT domain-containing protein [Bacillota bacterium]|nr:transglycosylase SLT domain-containing protein [Bacillota bacterium]